jgi:zinc transporter ZupT
MTVSLLMFVVTTGIAAWSVWFTSGARLQRLLPWTAGILLGVSFFWILPEIAQEHGLFTALGGVVPLVALLVWIDRYAYPICPFCIENLHAPHAAAGRFSRRAVRIGWPLLIVGCVHVFLDGWAIGLARSGGVSAATAALSYGVIVHKIPESVAIGIVAARLTHSRMWALATVGLIQACMLAGSLFSIFSGYRDIASLEFFSIPACACLILFGFLALEDEWRLNGRMPALRAAIPGLLACALAALATRTL